MNDIEFYKTISITKQLGVGESVIYHYVDIGFEVDEVILKNFNFYSGTAYTHSIKLDTDMLITDKTLITMPSAGSFHESYNIPFKHNGTPIIGTYAFTVKDYLGDVAPKLTASADIGFTLVFIKWKVR